MRLAFALSVTAALVAPLAMAAGPRLHSSLVSRNSAGKAANGDSSDEGPGSAISGNGRVVVFFSRAANLPGGDGIGYQVYARDMKAGRTRLASTKADGDPAEGFVSGAAVSGNGRFVVFYGPGDGLPGADGIHSEVWRHDLRTGTTKLASRSNAGAPGNGSSVYPSLSADGRYVTFQSSSANLPGGDGVNNFVYLRDMRRGRTILVSKTRDGDPAFGALYGQSVSASGLRVVFRSRDADLDGGDGSTDHVYLRDLARPRTVLLDRTSAGAKANDRSTNPSISADGKSVAFETYAKNLGASPLNEQAVLRDLRSSTTILVSRSSAGAPQIGGAFSAHPSANGRRVVFESSAPNLPGSNGHSQIYVRDLRRHKTRLLSRTASGKPGNNYSDYPSISADGRWVAFYGGSTNLGGNPAYTNVFRSGPLR